MMIAPSAPCVKLHEIYTPCAKYDSMSNINARMNLNTPALVIYSPVPPFFFVSTSRESKTRQAG